MVYSFFHFLSQSLGEQGLKLFREMREVSYEFFIFICFREDRIKYLCLELGE